MLKRLYNPFLGPFLGAAALCLTLASLPAQAAPPATKGDPTQGRPFMAASANPTATRVGAAVLADGGSAADAAIAMQLVLTLVEPQSSGIGGGAFALYWDQGRRHLTSLDARETAPAAAGPDLFLDSNGKPLPFHDAVIGGRSVGVPGVPLLLWTLHQRHGRLPWRRLVQPTITLARQGFAVSPRLAMLIEADRFLARDPAARALYYRPDGTPLPAGAILVNTALADTLERYAAQGPAPFYQGEIGRDIIAAVTSGPNPGKLAPSDLTAYRVIERAPLCRPYRSVTLCGMAPPSSGGATVAQILGMLESTNIASLAPNSTEAAHLITQASRLAFADRNRYLADPDFVPQPLRGLLDSGYLRQRSELIRPDRDIGHAKPGRPPGELALLGDDHSPEFPSTSHIAIVDAWGHGLSMTTTIEDIFGSRRMVRGFLLNNQLTDFSFAPVEDGRPVVNRVEPRKRPRSSMAPTIGFDAQGKPVLLAGSPGGARIIGYVAKALIGVIDWGLTPQQAIDLPNILNRNGKTELERGTAAEALAPSLTALGHDVAIGELTSGTQIIVIRPDGSLIGGADQRREGLALGR